MNVEHRSLFGFQINVKTLQLGSGKMIPASKFGSTDDSQEELVLNDEEKELEKKIFVS